MFWILFDRTGVNFYEPLQSIEGYFEFLKKIRGRLELYKIGSDVVHWGENRFESFDDLGEVFVELGFID